MNRTPIAVLSVEDNELVADAIGRKLCSDPDFEWLGWVSSVDGLRASVARQQPDVVCMDLDIPGQDALQMIRLLKAISPNSRVLILSGHLRRELIHHAVDAGAWGYLSKAEESRLIVDSIRRVAAGEFVLGKLAAAECGNQPLPPRRPIDVR